MRRLRGQRPEVPLHVVVAQVVGGHPFLAADEVLELHRVAHEEHRGVVTDHVEVALAGVELQREAARVAPGVWAATLTGHRGEPGHHLGLRAGRKHRRLGELADVLGHLEVAERAAALGVGLALRNAFPVEVGHLFDQVVVLQQNRAVGPDGERMLDARDRVPGVVRRVFVGHRVSSPRRGCAAVGWATRSESPKVDRFQTWHATNSELRDEIDVLQVRSRTFPQNVDSSHAKAARAQSCLARPAALVPRAAGSRGRRVRQGRKGPGRSNSPRGPIGNPAGGPPGWMIANSRSPPRRGVRHRGGRRPSVRPRMKPEKKTAPTMKTTPATMPTRAATAGSLDRRGASSCTCGVVGGAVATGPVAGSDEGVVGSLMATIMQTVLMCLSCFPYESAVTARLTRRDRPAAVVSATV